MDIQKIPAARLNPAAYNPRKDLKPGDKEYEKLKRSIAEFGFVEPVIWNRQTGNVVGGHQRLKVLLDLGVTDIDCVVVDLALQGELPKGFSIPTPVGHYSPDWAIVFHEGVVRHIYFIAETKGTMDSLNLRPIEKAKIDCAKKLFTTLSNGTVTYDYVDSYQQFMNKVMN